MKKKSLESLKQALKTSKNQEINDLNHKNCFTPPKKQQLSDLINNKWKSKWKEEFDIEEIKAWKDTRIISEWWKQHKTIHPTKNDQWKENIRNNNYIKSINNITNNDIIKINNNVNDKKTRIFYVDTARSITNKEGKKYWKCSIVENNKNILNFPNSKPKWSIEAEAYTILATVYWLKKQKEKSQIIIYTDSLYSVKWFNKIINWNNEKIVKEIETIKKIKNYKSRAYEFILLSLKISKINNFFLTLKWIKGKENPADYYSRH